MVKPLDLTRLFAALRFAATQHAGHTRKDAAKTPYITHPIAVAAILVDHGFLDANLLIAALLHDTVEDTKTTLADIEERFGSDVASLVAEVTDDKSLPWRPRKEKQLTGASTLSPRAALLRIADKIANATDLTRTPPVEWDRDKRMAYMRWMSDVVRNAENACDTVPGSRALVRTFAFVADAGV